MKRGKLCCCIFLLVPCFPAMAAYAREESCPDVNSGASDISLQLTLKDGRSLYHEGEIIPLELAFRSPAEKKYSLDTRNYDRSGRLNVETFCVEPDRGRDPLADYYDSGLFGFMGGALVANICLTRNPMSLTWTGELNYTVAYFSGRGMAELKEKLSQFPSGTRFVSIITAAQRNRHQSEIAEIENEITAGELQLDLQTPR